LAGHQQTTQWTTNQRKYIAWVAMPEDLREPRQLGDFAKKIHVHRVTLWEWRKLPGFNDEVQKLARQHLGDALPDALQALKHEAKRGNFNHLKLYLEMLGMYVQKIAPTSPDGTTEYGALDDTTIDREIATIIDSARARAPKRAAARAQAQVDASREE
jgi:hypothetical protein